MTRRQAIIWTDDGQFTDAYMRHSALMSKSPIVSIELDPQQNIDRLTTHTIVWWPNYLTLDNVKCSGLMTMMILTIITREMVQLDTHTPYVAWKKVGRIDLILDINYIRCTWQAF